MSRQIDLDIFIGQTDGRGDRFYSMHQVEEAFYKSGLAWAIQPGRGSEGGRSPPEDMAIARLLWEEQEITLQDFCNRLNIAIDHIFESLHQNWIKVVGNAWDGGPARRVHLNISADALIRFSATTFFPKIDPPTTGSTYELQFQRDRLGVSFRPLEREPSWMVVTSDGTDSLFLAQLGRSLGSHAVRHSALVTVFGKLNNGPVSLHEGLCHSGTVDDYQRSMTLVLPGGDTVDIGGDNATMEGIAAHKVSIRLSPSLYEELVVNDPLIYPRTLPVISREQLESSIQLKQLNLAITLARLRRADSDVPWLAGLLGKRLPPRTMELLCDSFRSFGKRSKKVAEHLTGALTEFIGRNIGVPEHGLSLVYAIESLGYVAKHQATTRLQATHCLTDLLHNDGTRFAHRHLPWASYIATALIGPASARQLEILRSVSLEIADCDGYKFIKESLARSTEVFKLSSPYAHKA